MYLKMKQKIIIATSEISRLRTYVARSGMPLATMKFSRLFRMYTMLKAMYVDSRTTIIAANLFFFLSEM